MTTERFREHLFALIKAKTPLFYFGGIEIQRALEEIVLAAQKAEAKAWIYSMASQTLSTGREKKNTDPIEVLDRILKRSKEHDECRGNYIVWVLVFYHLLLQQPDAYVLSRLREIVEFTRFTDTVVILGAPDFALPSELSDIQMVRLPDPDPSQVEASLDPELNHDLREKVVRSCTGLSAREMEDNLTYCIANYGEVLPEALREFRDARLSSRCDGVLVVETPGEDLGAVGGLRSLREWLRARLHGFLHPEILSKYGLEAPKGVLLTGVPGCGKSLICRAIASEWNLALFRLDPARIYSSTLGESEGRFQRALGIVATATPCILWIDEVEKGFASTDAMTDGGVSARILGSFLHFLQSRPGAIFVVATANDPTSLPPELLRKGRWDEIFFIDLPDSDERQTILEIHLANTGVEIEIQEEWIIWTDGFSGAEIQKAVEDACYECLYRGIPISQMAISKAIRQILPLSRMLARRITKLRRWGHLNARPANAQAFSGCGILRTEGHSYSNK